MDLNELFVFTRVVQAGSFVAAARALGMPKSTVSRKVSALEARLGARLLHRTTRTLSLTDVGRTYYEHAARAIAEVEEAEAAVTSLEEAPRGLLRVTTPLNFEFLAPIVSAFLERHPEVRLELVGADRVVDLVQEGFDVAVRAGALADSSLVARSLGALQNFLVASASFVDRHGAPEAPADLARFECVSFGAGPDRGSWRLVRDGREETVTVGGRLVVNDFEFLEDAVRAGLGIAMLPVFRIAVDLKAKRLVRILPAWCSPAMPLWAVYPSARHLSPKVKAFVEHVREHMTPPPWER